MVVLFSFVIELHDKKLYDKIKIYLFMLSFIIKISKYKNITQQN